MHDTMSVRPPKLRTHPPKPLPIHRQHNTPTDPKGEGDPILPLPTSLAYLQRFALASPNSKEAFQGTQGRSAHITGKDCMAADTPKGQAKATYHPTCYDPEWVAARMGENAPAIQYYLCDMSKPEGQRLVPWGRTFTKPDVAAVPQA